MAMMMFCRQVKNLPADDQRQPQRKASKTSANLHIQQGDGGEKATTTTTTTSIANTTTNFKTTATMLVPSTAAYKATTASESTTSLAEIETAEAAAAARTFMPRRRSSDENSLNENNAEILWNSMTNQHNSQDNTSRNNVNIKRNNDDVDDGDVDNRELRRRRHHLLLQCSQHLSNDHHDHCKLFVNSLSLHLDEYEFKRRKGTCGSGGNKSKLPTQPTKQIYFKTYFKKEENEDCLHLPYHHQHQHHYHHQHQHHHHQQQYQHQHQLRINNSDQVETKFQRRPFANTTPLVRYALTVLICLMLLISAAKATAQQQQQQQQHQLQPQQSITFSPSTSALYSFVPSNPGRHVYTSAFPRRRTADGSGLMQSRAVDTRVQFEVLEGQPKGTVVGFIPTRPDFTYRFNEPPREFSLDPVTGEIKTNMVLDREGMRERYDLVVLSSQPTYPIEVRITVLDINDNAPEFPEPSIAVSFSESAAKGTRCLLDAATDLDIGINGISNNYTIVEGNVDNKFRLAVTSNPSGDVSYLHLETTGDLDRESRAFYRLNISAKDGGNPPKYGFLQVNVSIIDVNDNPPVFDHSDYVVSLNESVPPGSSVLQVMASDKDLGDNSKITYYLADTENQFTVDPESGVISTTEHLNCPQQTCPTFSRPGASCPKSCVFTVFARDHGSPRQDGRAYVTVNLVDTNDHDPMIRFQYFPPTGSFATVDENALNGSVVAAVSVVDMDEGLNGETSIKITSGNELGHFRLEKTPSFDIVRVNGVLDREEIGKYNLTVVATDKGTPSRTATAYLIIHVNDVNDHEPVFEKSEYSAVLSELSPPGSFVASITATDEDTGVNALIFYDFVSGNNNQWFAIDSATGLITTQAPLDREVEGSVELSISARDGGPNPKWAYTQLKVTILDENDEAPQFTQSQINVTLSEATPPHTLIAMLTANDHDQGTNGSVTYTLAMVSERKYPEQFQLDSLTGQLTTRKSLDRELQQNYEILVIARDQGTPPKSSTATVNLHIEDVNDNAPQFYPKKYFHALAIPSQSNSNSNGNSNSNINSHNNGVSMTSTAGGADGGGSGSGNAGVAADIDIMSLLQKPLLKVFATDRDEGDNALITYTLNTGGDGLFVVDTWSGSIMLSSKIVAAATASTTATEILQHFTKPLYKLHISAKDRGERHSEQDAVVEIMMQHKMESLDFDSYSQTYEFQITEDHGMEQAHLGREVGQVQIKPQLANTPDILEYAIVYGDSEENFAINRKTGVITTAKAIDREVSNQYQLEVVARRGLSYGKCLVHVAVLDLNDNKPVFALEREDEVSLPENSAVGQEVYIARARDRDSGNNSRVTYTLTFNPDMLFRIGASTGVIYLQKPLKAEPNSNLQIELTATDHGKPALSAKQMLTIVITDVNDHTPVFDYTSYETSLLESTPVNDRFFSVAAHDKDLDMNGRLSYEILDGNVAQKFGIFPDGHLFVRSALDREERDYYALTVKCQDKGEPQRSSEVPVIIHIIDENDNAPQFTNSSFTFSLPENEPADAFVGKLTASDRDIGRNAELIYTLASPGKDFIIDSRNGFIKTLHPFDREELIQRMPSSSSLTGLAGSQNYILLEAIVADNGSPRLKDKVKIKIIITDVNDNAPEFVRAPYKVQISEGSLVGTQLMRVYTNDLDEGLNGDVYYSIIKGNQEGRFQLDDATGQLSLARKLDREYQNEYKLEVMAKDAAIEGQQLNSTTSIVIEILDENDMAPKFVETLSEISVLETTAISTELMRFKAVDLDLGINSQISFTITAGNRKDTFHIDSYTGILYLHKSLDYEETTVYNLNITASDGGSPRLSSTIVFIVHVEDENDNPPTFPNTAIVRQIKEGIDLKTPIVTVTAEDPDSGLNGKVTYSIVKQEPELPGGRHFGINTQTGVIHTLREIDRETIDTFRLTVVATDQAQKPEMQLSAEKLVTVIVEDINDNAPVFISMNAAILPSKNVQMYSQNRDGALVMYVHATDADSSSNGIVTYELVFGNMDLFKLQRNTGAITLRKPINRPEVRYQLSLKATDEAVQSERKSSDAYITIIATSAAGVAGPVFDQREQSGSVYENEPIGTSILTVSARLNNAEIEYYVTNVTAVGSAVNTAKYLTGKYSNIERLFDIDTKLGILSTAKELDREAGADTYEIEVYAIALGGSPRTTSTKLSAEKLVTVIVEDINDNAPVLISMNAAILPSKNVQMYSQNRDRALVMYVHAADADSSSNGIVTYKLVFGNMDLFKLQRNTGAITLRKPINRQKVRYQLSLKATDEAVQSERKSSDAYITINANKAVRYKYFNGMPLVFKFIILILSFAIDVANYASTGKLCFIAVKVIHASLNFQHVLKVMILDKNDSPPVFRDLPLAFNVSEDLTAGHLISTIRASDPDTLGSLTFTLMAGDDNKFVLEPDTGKLRLKESLDREVKENYKLKIRVSDGVQHTETIVDIQVTDTNDNPPQFDVAAYSFDIPENAPRGYQVGIIAATDPDLGNNAVVTYTVISDWANDIFSLNPQTGVLTLTARLDYEEIQHYILVVQAQDNGQPSLSTTLTVYCNVLDLNDNPPVFDPMSYSMEIYENVSIGTPVVTVMATDIDSGDNGRIEYTITSGDDNNDFEIFSNGTIRTQRTLDRETKSSYNLIVTASDCAKEFPMMYDDHNDYDDFDDDNNNIDNNDVRRKSYQSMPYNLQRQRRQYLQYQQQQLQLQQQFQNQQHQQQLHQQHIGVGVVQEPQQRLSSTVQVTIILKDVNDEAPVFVSSNVTEILENIPLNTVVMVVKAVDRDEGKNGYIEYLLDVETSVPFTLGSVDGLLRVSGKLDREMKTSYMLNVTARDRGEPAKTTKSQIYVKILDENDNAPIFDPKQYTASVAENASIGAMVLQVSAVDIDEGANGRVRFAIVGGDENRDFMISEDSGIVRVSKNLNYERKSRYTLTVKAEDSAADLGLAYDNEKGRNKLSHLFENRYDLAEISIVITDINDNPPTFLDSPYLAYVMENVIPPNGGYVLTVQAYDADTPPYNSLVRYFLKEGDTDLFRINASTGEITLQLALDREAKAEYTLTLVAMDTGSPPLTGTGVVKVIVQDMNDHSPEFERQSYYATVQENLPIGTKVIQPIAFDKDAGLNAKIRFTLLGEKLERFSCNAETGEITTAAILDREETAVYFLTLMAQDSSATEPRATAVNLTINVKDVNDNMPIFEANQYHVNIPDKTGNNEFVFGAWARDSDEEQNALVTYNISGKDVDYFTINPKTGVIKTKQNLGSDLNRQYTLMIQAYDQGTPSKSSQAELMISLKSSSYFPSFNYMANTQFMLPEDIAPGKKITTITASSPKKGSAGNIRYSIAGGNLGEAVKIDSSTGVVTIGKDGLDYELATQYEIWLEALDSDRIPLRSVMLLTINVTDANDNAPIMEKLIYKAEVMEEESPPQTIVKVKANDRDSGENGEVSYRLLNDFEGTFEIDADSGEIYTTMRLDREEISHYELTVEAVDQGMTQLTGSATVLLNLLDKNDNPPKFTRLFSVNVTENAEIGSFVIQVTSMDLDEGVNANALYTLTENPGEKFKLDSISGNITVAGHIDREEQDEYILKITASDGAWRSDTPITITIQDQNDNAPEFEHEFYNFNFPELQRSVAFVGQVVANDRDKHGPNSVISYSLQHPSDLFTIDPATGEIFSKKSIKYKHSQYEASPENVYTLTVIATDNGKPPLYSECMTNINIVDANNHAPKFEKSLYLSPVPEHARVGQRVVRVQAHDLMDTGVNAEIEYSFLKGNGSEYFVISQQDGWISLSKAMEVPTNTLFYLNIKAADHGVPSKSDNTHVHIIVTGENLFLPEFTADSYQVIVPENEPIGSTILTILASDRDEGPNGMLHYAIADGNELPEFKVDADTGAIILLQPLDYDSIQEYHFNISVQDLGFKPKTAVAQVTVILTDINDNPPLFNQSEYHAFISENKPANSYVFRARAKDKDSPKNAVIRYSITAGSGKNYFTINPNTGLITSSVSFDYEERNEYALQIMAANPDSPMHSMCKVIIHIRGVNEFYPQFVQPVFHFDVSESAEVGTPVGSIQATDKDSGEDGNVYYLLVGSSNDKGFSINPSTGFIYVSRHLDRETQSRAVLTVMAKNYGSIRGNDTDEAQVIISIQDGNDPPEFLKPYYTAKISESAAIGTKVVSVKAVDKDVRPQNNQFSYSIINGNINQTFKVDPQTGEIATSKRLDREQVPEYNLVVGAIDTGLPPQTGTAMVKIELLDVNDNGPTFPSDGLIGYVSENEPAGTSIMTLSATDPDLPPNGGPFMYYLIGGKHKAFITIDKHSGLVKSTRSFDREQTPELEAIIEVEDNGQPRQKAQHKLIIKVLDQNDSPSSPRTVHVLLNVFNDYMPIGKIADVHPNDADVTGNYRCRIIPSSQSSPMGLLIIPNACDLHTTYQTSVNNGYSYSISGNDGKHGDVVSTVTVGFQNFDNSTIANSITVLIRNMTAENFLSLHYRSFVELMKSAVDSSDELLVFSVRNTTYNSTDLEVMIALKMANQGYRLPHYVVDRLSKKREAVTRLLTTATSIVIGYDPCSSAQACDNGGLCTSERKLHDTESLNIVDSESLIFSGNLVTHDFVCKCPDGFMGQQCDKRQDPCAPTPCHGNAQCRRLGYDFQCICPPNREGKYCQQERGDVCSGNPCTNGGSCRSSPDGSSFFCLCRPGYRGNQCEHVADSCRPNPCLHGGVCVALKPGYKCTCSEGRYGRHCEKSTYGFGDLSYMSFPPLDAATNDISVIFATTKPDALLLYNYGIQSGGRSDFIAIEVVRGKAFFSFGGARTAIATVVVGGNNRLNLADGNWHKVTATRNGRVMSLSVAKCVDNGDVCEECRPGDSTCYADDVGPISTLNFNKHPLLLGGLISADPVLERPGQLHTDDLVGCVHSVSINGRALNLSQPLKQRSISLTCNRNLNGGPCTQSTSSDPSSTLCGPFGSCMDRWDTAMCQCGGDLLSPDCHNSLESISITDGAFVEFKITEKHRRMQLLDNLYAGNSIWSYDITRQRRFTVDSGNLTALAQTNELPKTLSIMFRTFKENGLVLFAASNNHYTSLELQNGKMTYYSNQDSIVNMTVGSSIKLNDGKWHNITLHSTNRILRILIDGKRAGEELDFAGVHDYLDPYLTVLSVGGVRREYLQQEHTPVNYEGCVANFTINNEIQPFNGSGSVFSEVLSRGKITHGCAGVMGIGAAQVADPISIGVTLVIVFFVILVVAILGSYVIYRFRGKQEKIGSLSCGVPGFKIKHNPPSTMLGGAGVSQNQSDHVLSRGIHGNEAQVGYHNDNGDLIRSVPGHHMVGPELISKKFKEREINPAEHQQQRPQRPDIIEREVVSKSPPLRDEHHPPIPPPSQSHHPHDHASSVDMGSEYPEHYDLENASSIAPSDIDIVYHYKGYREAGGVRKYKATPAPVASYTHHKHQSAATQQQHRHSPRHGVGGPFVPRGVPPQGNQPPPPTSTPRQHQSTPLARLSPSSELSSQQPRILTLHDISGKPLQSALLATTSSSGGVGKDALHSNSERSLNSPVMSQLSGQSSSASRQKPVVSTQATAQTSMGLTAEEIERLNARPRTSSLVSTLDAVSSSSEAPRGTVGAHHLTLGGGLHSTDVDAHSSTSTDESGNDSFTCSEIEYDNNSINGDAKFSTSKSIPDERNPVGRAMSGDGGRGSTVTKAPPMPPHSFDGFDSSFRGSLSTLVASDDDLSTHMGALYRQANSAASPTAPPPMGWEYLLNWGPNFESLVGVFKDIAELPDNVGTDQRATGSLRMQQQQQNKQSEEYV